MSVLLGLAKRSDEEGDFEDLFILSCLYGRAWPGQVTHVMIHSESFSLGYQFRDSTSIICRVAQIISKSGSTWAQADSRTAPSIAPEVFLGIKIIAPALEVRLIYGVDLEREELMCNLATR